MAFCNQAHRTVDRGGGDDHTLFPMPEGLTLSSRPDADVGRAVLETEREGLRLLAASLDGAFGQAVALLDGCTGRVVVSGMGKSGHVGRKVAATLASTGTPALFVHPAEASHGDLGMIVPGDVVLAISNSGETSELADLLAHAHRFDVRVVAVTGRAGSTLAEAADVVLVLPDAPEACSIGMAPTTSTTMQMALGDALAVALMTRRGFDAEHYGAFHPGGRLGARLRRVSALMHTGDAVPLLPAAAGMDQALLVMTGKGFGCLGAVDGAGRLVGVITDGDLRRAMGPDLLHRRVEELMSSRPRTVGPHVLAADALRLMGTPRPVTSLFVVEDEDRPVGILHVHDLLRAGIA